MSKGFTRVHAHVTPGTKDIELIQINAFGRSLPK
jgi:hypothetical protein